MKRKNDPFPNHDVEARDYGDFGVITLTPKRPWWAKVIYFFFHRPIDWLIQKAEEEKKHDR